MSCPSINASSANCRMLIMLYSLSGHGGLGAGDGFANSKLPSNVPPLCAHCVHEFSLDIRYTATP